MILLKLPLYNYDEKRKILEKISKDFPIRPGIQEKVLNGHLYLYFHVIKYKKPLFHSVADRKSTILFTYEEFIAHYVKDILCQ